MLFAFRVQTLWSQFHFGMSCGESIRADRWMRKVPGRSAMMIAITTMRIVTSMRLLISTNAPFLCIRVWGMAALPVRCLRRARSKQRLETGGAAHVGDLAVVNHIVHCDQEERLAERGHHR